MSVWIEAPEDASQCSNISVTVNISQVEGFDSASYDVTYDPDIMQVTDISDGDIGGNAVAVTDWGFIPAGVQGVVRIINNVGGVGGVSGTGMLAIINFSVSCINCGNASLSFSGEHVVYDNESVGYIPHGLGTW